MCTAAGNGTATPLPTTTEWITDYTDIVSKFSLRSAEFPDDDMCYIEAGRPETIRECQFNRETQTFIIIHGWTVSRSGALLPVPDVWLVLRSFLCLPALKTADLMRSHHLYLPTGTFFFKVVRARSFQSVEEKGGRKP